MNSGIADKVSPTVTSQIFVALGKVMIVRAPAPITARFGNAGARASFSYVDGRPCLALTPDPKSGRHFVEKRHGANKTLQFTLNAVQGLSDKNPKFGSTPAESAIWGSDGVLRITMPRTLNPLAKREVKARDPDAPKLTRKTKKPKRMPKAQRAPAKEDGVHNNDPAVRALYAAPTVPLKEDRAGPILDATHPDGPTVDVGDAAPKDKPSLRGIRVAYTQSTTCVILPPDLAAKFDGKHVAVRLAYGRDNKLYARVHPDPQASTRFGKPMQDGCRVVAVNAARTTVPQNLEKFSRTNAIDMEWDGPDLLIWLPDNRQQARNITPGSKKRQKVEVAAQPITHLRNTEMLELGLPEAVSAVNNLVRQMGDKLTLTITAEGTLKATIMQEFE